MKGKIIIRPIRSADSSNMASIIRTVMTEFGAVGSGFSIEDAEVDDMYGAYSDAKAIYYVLEKNGVLLGGAGIAQLAGTTSSVCELKKMYFLKEARGLGMGRALAEKLIKDARNLGYGQIYLETLGSMNSANKLYKSLGFELLETTLGNTGHCGCDTFYALDL